MFCVNFDMAVNPINICCSNLFFGFSCSLISKNRTNLHTPLFQKKKLLHDPLLLSCFTLNPFLFQFLFFNLFFNSFVATCYSFLFISCCCFFCVSFCLFSCLVSFFVVFIRLVNIVFSESSSFKCVSFPTFFDSLF